VGYFELKLHKYILGTPETNITSCKKGHNRCPLRITFIFLVMFQDEHLLDSSNLWLMYYPLLNPYYFYLIVLANLLLFSMG